MLDSCDEKYIKTMYKYGYKLGNQFACAYSDEPINLVHLHFVHGCAYTLANGFLDALVLLPVEKKIRICAQIPAGAALSGTYLCNELSQTQVPNLVAVVFGVCKMATSLEADIEEGILLVLDELYRSGQTNVALCSPTIDESLLLTLESRFSGTGFMSSYYAFTCSDSEEFSLRKDSGLSTALLHSATYACAQNGATDFLKAVKQFRSLVPL